MSRILEARVLPYDLPLASPWRTATRERLRRRGALLILHTEEGVSGLGEAAPLPGRTEARSRCLATLERAAGSLRGLAVADALERLEVGAPELRPVRAGARAARSAVATALFDLRSRLAGRALAVWLSDRFGDGREPARRVPVNASLPRDSVQATVAASRAAIAAGFPALKLKLGPESAEVARVRAVREATGPRIALRLDLNGAWKASEALDRLEALAPLGIEYVEQPLSEAAEPGGRPAALAELAALRARSPIPLALDESVADLEAVEAALEAGAASVLVLKPAVLGGGDVALAAAARARAAGVRVVFTSALDGVVGRLAALHAAAALGPDVPPCGLATGDFLAREIARGDERLDDGHLVVPAGPGLSAWLPSEDASLLPDPSPPGPAT